MANHQSRFIDHEYNKLITVKMNINNILRPDKYVFHITSLTTYDEKIPTCISCYTARSVTDREIQWSMRGLKIRPVAFQLGFLYQAQNKLYSYSHTLL